MAKSGYDERPRRWLVRSLLSSQRESCWVAVGAVVLLAFALALREHDYLPLREQASAR